ncbi:aspartic peptidase domain-containing protein, partial [Blyttiomyces helicus]
MKTGIVLSALALTAVAAPIAKSDKKSEAVSVQVHRRKDTRTRGHRAKTSRHATIAKYRHHILNKRDTQLANANDQSYSAEIIIGNGQKFMIDLDTGSSDLWVTGPTCQDNDGSCEASGRQLDTNDKTLADAGQQFDDKYGSGEASGDVFQGHYKLAGATAKNAFFGSSTGEQGFNFQSSGILGLSFPFVAGSGQGVTDNVQGGQVPIQ